LLGEEINIETQTSWLRILKFAGAFIAFMIGSGYASGQEVMQFFTAYGLWSVGGILISMVLFAWSGVVLMRFGFNHKDKDINPFHHYCGRVLGTFLEWFIPLFLFAVVVVMISGGGATMKQYFGLPHYVGAGLIAFLVMISNLFGLKRLVDIIGSLGPITIVFTLVVSLVALAMNPGGIAKAAATMQQLGEIPKATSTWWLAGVLYVAYNITGSIPFLAEMGKTAATRQEAFWGALLGGVVLMSAALLSNLALLAYIGDIVTLPIPNLYFAEMISPTLGFMFSLILLSEIYSTAAPMLWVVVNKFSKEGTSKNKILVVLFSIFAFFGGQLPFGLLIGTVYPYTGYLGIIVLITIAIKEYGVKRA